VATADGRLTQGQGTSVALIDQRCAPNAGGTTKAPPSIMCGMLQRSEAFGVSPDGLSGIASSLAHAAACIHPEIGVVEISNLRGRVEGMEIASRHSPGRQTICGALRHRRENAMTRRPDRSWFAALMLPAAMIVASPLITEAACPGVPALCGMTCSPDAFGTPVYCSNAQCTCAPGYDTQSAPGGGVVCQPIQPEIVGTESDEYDCPGYCSAAVPWATLGSIYSSFDLVPVNGIAPGGEAFMPVWGYQATQCGDHGVPGARCQGGDKNGATCTTATGCPGGFCTRIGTCENGSNSGRTCSSDADCPNGTCRPIGICSTNGGTCSSDTDCPGGTCEPTRTWAGCAPDPFPFCYGIQESDEGDFDYDSCDENKGCGDVCGDVICVQEGANGCEQFDLRCKYLKPPETAPPGTTDACNYCSACVSDFTSAWPYIDHSVTCSI